MTSRDHDPSALDDPSSRAGGSSSFSDDATAASVKASKKPRLNAWQETVLLVGVAVIVALVVKQFFLQAFYIPSESMEPALVLNDRILVEKPSYWFGGEPERGDVVVFKDPGGWLGQAESDQPGNVVTEGLAKVGLFPSGGHLVKRVIGVAGDTVRCCDKQGRIAVNGRPLNEPYARPGTRQGESGGDHACYGPMTGRCHWSSGPIPDGQLFVMGDNRARSADSTVHMCTDQMTDCARNPYVPVDNVVGRVWALAWPLSRAHWMERPDTFADVPDAEPAE